MSSKWREHAAPIIAKVIATVGTEDAKALKAELRAAYPFGPRQYHPYKIWCDEIRVQLGKKPVKPRKGKTAKAVAENADQGKLFE